MKNTFFSTFYLSAAVAAVVFLSMYVVGVFLFYAGFGSSFLTAYFYLSSLFWFEFINVPLAVILCGAAFYHFSLRNALGKKYLIASIVVALAQICILWLGSIQFYITV